MRVRTPGSSRVEMTQIVMPSHTNGVGGVLFGGTLVQWIDVCAAVAAMRHCGGSAVTASIDRLDFLVPIHVGDIVVLQAQVNYAARTSMEVGCRVETEDPRSGERRYTTKAYLTFVALDSNGKPRRIPKLAAKTKGEKRRYVAAEERRAERLRAAGRTAEAAVAAAQANAAPRRAKPAPNRSKSAPESVPHRRGPDRTRA